MLFQIESQRGSTYRTYLNRSRDFYFFSKENAAYNQGRPVFKGGFYCFGCNTDEGEVEIIMTRRKKCAPSIIFSRELMLLLFEGCFYLHFARAALI